MYKVSGYFINDQRYTDTFKNQSEFEWVMHHIYRNECCCSPDTICGKKSKEQLPAYIRNYINDPELSIVYHQED